MLSLRVFFIKFEAWRDTAKKEPLQVHLIDMQAT